MRRSAFGLAGIVVMTVASLVTTTPASAFHDDCSDDPMPGATLQQGNPTTSPPTNYRITTEGVEVTVGPILGLGTVHLEVDTAEAALVVRDTSGDPVHGVGIDTSGASEAGLPGDWETGVCLVAAGTGNSYYVDFDDPIAARIGMTVRVFQCTVGTGACTTVLGPTGAEPSVNTPAQSCVWVNGFQQNPLATCPAV